MINKEYITFCNKILIHTDKSGVAAFISMKEAIKEYSTLINFNIELMNTIDRKYKSLKDQKNNEDLCLNMKHLKDTINIYNFTLDSIVNLFININGLYLSKNKIEQFFYIKSMYIELYRFLERYNSDLGIIKKISSDANLNEQFSKMNKCKNNFEKKHYEDIKSKRNHFFAHFKDKKDYRDYYNIVKQDQFIKAFMCGDFLIFSREIYDLFGMIFNYTSSKI